jgi:hypothetical protein
MGSSAIGPLDVGKESAITTLAALMTSKAPIHAITTRNIIFLIIGMRISYEDFELIKPMRTISINANYINGKNQHAVNIHLNLSSGVLLEKIMCHREHRP